MRRAARRRAQDEGRADYRRRTRQTERLHGRASPPALLAPPLPRRVPFRRFATEHTETAFGRHRRVRKLFDLLSAAFASPAAKSHPAFPFFQCIPWLFPSRQNSDAHRTEFRCPSEKFLMGIRKRSDGHQKGLQCPLDGAPAHNGPKSDGCNAFLLRREGLPDME